MPVALSQELEVSLFFLSSSLLFLSLLLSFQWLLHGSLPPHLMGGKHLGCGEWAPSWPVWFRVSHSLTPSQSTIGLRQKGKRCHVHLPCFFTEQANLNIAYDHNLSRIKIAQNKWQMAGKGALCQAMAEGWGGGLLRWILQAWITTANRTPRGLTS